MLPVLRASLTPGLGDTAWVTPGCPCSVREWVGVHLHSLITDNLGRLSGGHGGAREQGRAHRPICSRQETPTNPPSMAQAVAPSGTPPKYYPAAQSRGHTVCRGRQRTAAPLQKGEDTPTDRGAT